MTQTPPSNAPLVVVLDDGYGDTHTEALALQSLAARVVLGVGEAGHFPSVVRASSGSLDRLAV